MKADQFKQNQALLKEQYKSDPESATQQLSAIGNIDFENLAFNVTYPQNFSPAGLHEAGGGDGSFACPVEIMLAAWVSCMGVTLAAVAHSMKLHISACRLEIAGTMDFKGTLAVDRTSAVGLTDIAFEFDFQTNEPEESIQKLVSLSERFCVVHQTMQDTPNCRIKIKSTES